MPHIKIMKRGLDYAIGDFISLAAQGTSDVKPKEDQIKCGLYRAFSDAGDLVHIEAAYGLKGLRCDVVVHRKDGADIAIEIKTAWAGMGWVNKPEEQWQSWSQDIGKLKALATDRSLSAAYFVLLLGYEAETLPIGKLRERVDRLATSLIYESPEHEMNSWNGLNRLQYSFFDVLNGMKMKAAGRD